MKGHKVYKATFKNGTHTELIGLNIIHAISRLSQFSSIKLINEVIKVELIKE